MMEVRCSRPASRLAPFQAILALVGMVPNWEVPGDRASRKRVAMTGEGGNGWHYALGASLNTTRDTKDVKDTAQFLLFPSFSFGLCAFIVGFSDKRSSP